MRFLNVFKDSKSPSESRELNPFPTPPPEDTNIRVLSDYQTGASATSPTAGEPMPIQDDPAPKSPHANRMRILVVDDELHIAKALQRSLIKDYDVLIATNGDQALQVLSEHKGICVIVSDMRMPGMDGAALLNWVKEAYPEIVRVMLTGYADLDSASRAINEGAIFRFASKPCLPADFRSLVQAAVEQHQLLTMERELLENTLRGAVEVLSQVLELVNPTAFGRATRIRTVVNHITRTMRLQNAWMFDTAALMSQLGCATLPQSLLERHNANTRLTDAEENSFRNHPVISRDLLSQIPRLEVVAEMVGQQLVILESPAPKHGRQGGSLGAEILAVADEYDRLTSTGMGHGAAKQVIGRDSGRFSPGVYDALLSIAPPSAEEKVFSITLKELVPGMIFLDDLKEAGGTLLVASGHVATGASVCRLKEMATSRWDVIQPFRVRRGGAV